MSLARVCALTCGCLLLACSAPAPAPEQKTPQVVAPAPASPPPTITVKAETPPEPEPTPVVEAAPVIAADATIGVAACDAYAARYRTCIADQVRAIEKDRHTRVLAAQLENWRAASADPKLAPALDGECAAASAAARASTRILGCVWREGDTTKPELPKGGKLKPEVRMEPRRMPDLDDPFGL